MDIFIAIHGFTLLIISTLLYQDNAAGKRRHLVVRSQSQDRFRWIYLFIKIAVPFGLLSVLFRNVTPQLLILFENIALQITGIVCSTLGILIFIWAKRTLGKNYSPCFDVRLPQRIVVEGPYAYVRHPIYTANLFVLGGLSLSTGSLFLIASFALTLAYYLKSAKVEERELLINFPSYAELIHRTGRFFPKFVR